MRIGRILVATDFSEHSDVAARLAAALATHHGAELTLLHVDQTPEALSGDTEPLLGVRPELWRQYRESSRRLVDEGLEAQLAELARWAGSVRIDTAVDYGDIATAIERRARAWPADLIVMGSHGAAANERYLFGSVLTQLLPSAPCPLLVTRSSQRDRLPTARGFERPLVGIDYSRFAEPAARMAADLAAADASVELVHVWRPPILLEAEGGPALSDADRRALDAAAELAIGRERDRLDEFRKRVVGGQPARCAVAYGRVASALLDHARQQGCDLIVVGAHGGHPGGAGGGSIGSVTDRVLRHAPVPVLFVPPAAAAEVRAPRRTNGHAAAQKTNETPRSRTSEVERR